MKRRTDVENLSPVRFELLKSRPTDIEGSLQIDIDDCAEPIRRQVLGLTEEVSGGAVNRDINLAETIDRRGNSLFNFFGLSHIGGYWEGLAHARLRSSARIVNHLRRRLKM